MFIEHQIITLEQGWGTLNVGVPAEFNSRTPEPANQGLQDAIKYFSPEFSGLELNSAGDGPQDQRSPALEWFLKDHVTLKTGEMAPEISAFSKITF